MKVMTIVEMISNLEAPGCQTNSLCQYHKKWDPREGKENRVENITDNVSVKS